MLDDEGGLLHGGPYCCGHMGEEGRGEGRRGENGRKGYMCVGGGGESSGKKE